jgi:type IV pilus modification protein PilV
MPITTGSKQRGFAMMEALVTAVVVAIAISGVGVLLLKSIQATQDSSQLSQGMWVVQDLVGRMRANSTAIRSGDYLGITNLDNCDNPPLKMCASHRINNAYQDGDTDCSTTDMATYDNWITVCSLEVSIIDEDEPDNLIFDSPSDFLSNPVLTNTCLIPGELGGCVKYLVDLTWNTKLKKGSTQVAERTNTNNYSMIIEVN